jgi:hypothetical protein
LYKITRTQLQEYLFTIIYTWEDSEFLHAGSYQCQ